MSKKVKRPRDTNQLAKKILSITIGEEENEVIPEGDDPNESIKAKSGRKGGKARAKKLTKAKRSEIAKKAAKKRWG